MRGFLHIQICINEFESCLKLQSQDLIDIIRSAHFVSHYPPKGADNIAVPAGSTGTDGGPKTSDLNLANGSFTLFPPHSWVEHRTLSLSLEC